VAQVCNHYGIRLTRDGRLIDEDKTDKLFMKVYQKGELVLEEKVQDQVTVNTEAKDIIKDLFPNIPDQDLFKIIKTAFQLGDGKVGTAEEIPLHRRATLAVVAHIRHVYTKYDSLLRKMPYNNARHEVEAETLQKLVEWRGNSKTDEGAINEVLDDVIVISDGEVSDPEPEDANRVPEANLRVEELDGNAYWPAVARPFSPSRFVIDELSSGYRYVPQVVQPYRLSETELIARERQRAARWEQARQQYHTTLSQPGSSYQRVIARESSPVRHLIPLDPPPQPRVIEREYLGQAPYRLPEAEVGPCPADIYKVLAGSSIPNPIPGFDADIHQVLSRPESPAYRPSQIQFEPAVNNHRARIAYQAHSRPLSPVGPRFRRRSVSPGGGDGTIRPSIEGPNGAYSPGFARQNEEARAFNQNASASYRDRQDPPEHHSTSVHDTTNGRDPTRSRWVEGEEATSALYKNPFYAPHEPSRLMRDISPPSTGAEPRPITPLNTVRRVLVPEHDITYDPLRGHPAPRANPFDDRSGQPVRRLEALRAPPRPVYETLRRPMPETPPRRILEPIPADDPYSDAGPQRYREHIPVSEQYYASAPPTTYPPPERRIVYANPPEDYVVERRYDQNSTGAMPTPANRNPFGNTVRYEPLPESSYMRR
jgi:hypothetical protein